MPESSIKKVKIYTDGSSRGNPGPGGYGVVLMHGDYHRELSQGFVRTTNNRMEILAAVTGLEALKYPCEVTVFSDSKYLVNAMSQGWIQAWKKRGWKRKDGLLKNADLWRRMDQAVRGHKIHWRWVKGHNGNKINERCDRLATKAADSENRKVDAGFS